MRILFRILLPFLFVLVAIPAVAQRTDKEIKQRENELQNLRNEIQAYEKKIHESDTKEKMTLERLDDLLFQRPTLVRQPTQIGQQVQRSVGRERFGHIARIQYSSLLERAPKGSRQRFKAVSYQPSAISQDRTGCKFAASACE